MLPLGEGSATVTSTLQGGQVHDLPFTSHNDFNNTNDPGGRTLEFVARLNFWLGYRDL